jgi:UPF0271 protein
MIDTGSVVTVDLNADLAEGEVLSAGDLAVLESVSSVSIACGFHAGAPGVMRATASACLERGVTIGAHVSFRDREGFGRRHVDSSPPLLVRDIIEQCEVLAEQVVAAGGAVTYVKPHGALYNRMGVEPAVAGAVVEAVSHVGIGILVAQPGTVVVGPAIAGGLRVVSEGFPDRGYLPGGLLAPRDRTGALIEDPALVGRRAVSLAGGRGVVAVDGSWAAVDVETLCVHGDSPHAPEAARSVRHALESAGITVLSFAPTDGTDRPPPDGRLSGPS